MRFLIFLLLPVFLFGNMMTPFHSDFIEAEYQNFDLIYPKEYEKYTQNIANKIEQTLKVYEKSFGYKLRNRLKIILASSNDQIINGYSTPVYTNKIVLFNSGSAGVDYFSSPLWIESLINHELAHTFQMNAQKSKVSQIANNIFGNSIQSPIVQVFPNAILPTALLEGNAVLNESFFQIGGRLYNGILKAKFMAIFSKIDITRFLNIHLDFPFTEEKYIVGSYFNLFLAKKYGINRVNRFFLEHSTRFIQSQAFFINSSFENYFDKSFDNLFTEFLEYWKTPAKKFQKLQGEAIAFSEIFYPLTKTSKKIFVTSSLKDEQPETKIFEKEIGEFQKKSYFGTGGKIFEINGEIVESKSDFLNSQKIGFALWKNGNPLKNSQDKIYLDNFQGNFLYFDLNSSLESAKLYKNEKFIDTVCSSAIFDKKGSIYYFRQDGEFLQLMKDGETEIFRFQGFSAQILDVENENIYFIANSEFGSTLYIMQDGGLFRVSKADNIIDGKLIDSENMILTAVESDGYHYYKFKIPKTFDYSEPWIVKDYQPNLNADYFKFFQNQNIAKISEHKYNSFSNLEFSELFWESDSKLFSNLNLLFTDAIGYNSLNLNFKDLTNERRYSFSYSNFRHWINYGFSAEFIKSEIKQDSEKYSTFVNFQTYSLENISSNFKIKTIYDTAKTDEVEFVADYYFGKVEQYGESILPKNSIFIQPFYKYSKNENSAGFSFGFGKEILNQTFFNSSYKGLFSFQQKDNLNISLIEDVDDVADIYLEGLDNFILPSKNLHKFSGTILRTFDTSIYFENFPMGLRRISPYFRYNFLLEDRDLDLKYIEEKVFGIVFEILAFRKLVTPINLKYIENSISGKNIKFDVGLKF